MESGEAGAVIGSERGSISTGPLWLAWMMLAIAGAVVALFIVGRRPANPLDWEIKARTPEAFMRWEDETASLLPVEIARELNSSLAFISSRSPGTWPARSGDGHYANEANPFCLRINRRTVREVIVDGYSVANEALLQRVVGDSDRLVSTLSRQSDPATAADDQSKIDRAVAGRQQVIDAYKAQIEVNNQRVAELQQLPAASR